MTTLSLAMIVRNEEPLIERVLNCARPLCDEMVIVDTGSTDRTVELAEKCGAKVWVNTQWTNPVTGRLEDFAAARNYSFSLCTSDWILWLDADDVLPESTIAIGQKIKAELLPTCKEHAVFAPYEYAYEEDGSVALLQERERFIRQSAGFRWEGRIHEVIPGAADSFIRAPEFVVQHHTPEQNTARKSGRNLQIYEQYLDVTTCSLHDLFLYGRELRAADRTEEALNIYTMYLQRWPADQWDLFQEPYIVRLFRTECLQTLGRFDEAIKAACDAVAYVPTRAEAYGMLAAIQLQLGCDEGAFPALLASAACKLPQHGGMVLKEFYGPKVHDELKACKQRLQENAK